ncbi:MAG TPA: A24 family peptidase [Burkholderiaceae bacterium]|nr:A24 family peptidase [Burkholderiaceae bacterium]
MQHNTFLWWLAAVALTGMAALTACWGVMAARYYARLLDAGACPDGTTLFRAWMRASRVMVPSIIRFRWRQWVRALSMPGFWAGAALGTAVMLSNRALAEALAILAVSLVLLWLGSIDIRTGLLPDALTQPVMWAGLAFAWVHGAEALAPAFAGVVVGYAVPAAMRGAWLWWRQHDALGYGDVKLLAGIGAWTGPHDVLHVLLLACLGAIVWAGIRYRGLALHRVCPFGPFLSGSAIVWLMWPVR